MKVLIASDKFKDSLTAPQACDAIAKGILLARPHARITIIPVSDGGDGFAQLMTEHAGGEWRTTELNGPLQEPNTAGWGWHASLLHAWADCAEVIGLAKLKPERRNPLYTTTYGLGQLLGIINRQGARHTTLGLGGSSTHDGGCGLAAALGYRFLDKQGKSFIPTGASLIKISAIIPPKNRAQLATITACADTTIPFLGVNGAAYTYARQKGAAADQLPLLEEGSEHLFNMVNQQLKTTPDFAGAGAAGGLGFGLKAFCGAKIKPGADLVSKLLRLEEKIQQADLVVTGEGRFDSSSYQGKITGEILKLCQKHNKTAKVFCGSSQIADTTAVEVIQISLAEQSLQDNLAQAKGLLIQAAAGI
jgi:glycerate kinase